MQRTCPRCGKTNRIPVSRLADVGRCGACKAELAPTSEPIDVDERRFGEIVESVSVPILVDFWAGWCGPCRMAAPMVAQVAKKLAGRALVLKVDTERHPGLAARFEVRGIPNFVVLARGRVVAQQAGVASAAQLEQMVLRS